MDMRKAASNVAEEPCERAHDQLWEAMAHGSSISTAARKASLEDCNGATAWILKRFQEGAPEDWLREGHYEAQVGKDIAD